VYNTCTPSTKYLYVWSDRAPDAEPLPGKFKIKPLYADYYFEYDFSPTYPGIAPGFVPPFRACGQNDSARGDFTPEYNTTFIDGWGFVTNFTLTFTYVTAACLPPCEKADIWLEVVNIPDPEKCTLSWAAITGLWTYAT
jgi:hypothetical protein